MSAKNLRILIAILGFIGIVALSASFAVNPAPPAGATLPQLVEWGKQHETLVQIGAWLQAFGSFLEIILILGLLYITGAIRRFTGLITASAALLIMGVSLVEIAFYLSAIEGGVSGDLTTLNVSLNLIKAIQHAYVIAPAPAMDAGLGIIILTTALFKGITGRILGYLGIGFGIVLAVLGLIGTFKPLQIVIDNVLTGQQVWLIAIAIVLLLSARKMTGSSVVASESEATLAPSK